MQLKSVEKTAKIQILVELSQYVHVFALILGPSVAVLDQKLNSIGARVTRLGTLTHARARALSYR